jgi:diadenosine tetraphosphatase ApaH/serine/threonine PP2A family protein phosphatase
MTSFFNFRDECNPFKKIYLFTINKLYLLFDLKIKLILIQNKGLYKFDQEIYDVFMDSFDTMPLACIVNGKFLALHGGISPELKTVNF